MNSAESKLNPKIVLGVAAHPDDLEFGAAGSLAKWAAAGAKVYYLILTDGGTGSSDPKASSADLIATRRVEQQAAGKIVGTTDIFFAHFEDGRLENISDVRQEIVRRIRQVKPDTVVGWDPTFVYSTDPGLINHPDHRAAGQAMLDAVYPLARDHLSYPELLQEGYEPHKVQTVLMMASGGENYACDITGRLDAKLKALAAHVSQNGVEPAAVTTERARACGAVHGFAAAESFMRVDLRS